MAAATLRQRISGRCQRRQARRQRVVPMPPSGLAGQRYAGAPAGRVMHTATWSGTRMIVWGGFTGADDSPRTYFNDGGRYDPVGNTWAAVSTAAAPTGRHAHTALWSGRELLIWGGRYTVG